MTLVVTLLAVMYFVCTLVSQFSTDIGKKYIQVKEYIFLRNFLFQQEPLDKITAGQKT